MDDSLLEKLLSLIKDGIYEKTSCSSKGEFGFVEVVLKYTHFIPLAEQVMFSLTDSKIKVQSSVKVYAIRLLGITLKNENIFLSQKYSLFLQEFSRYCRSGTNQSLTEPSIKNAVLNCIYSISEHPEGTMWIINEKLMDYVFSNFSCTSYYVRKTAVRTLAETVALWNSSEFSALPTSQQTEVNNALQQIVPRIFSGIENFLSILENENDTFNECCILTLKEVLETEYSKNIFGYINFNLTEKFMQYLMKLDDHDVNSKQVQLHENFLHLLLAMYSRYYPGDPVKNSIELVLQALFFARLFASAIEFGSSLLSISEKHRRLSSVSIRWFCTPLQALAGSDVNDEPTSHTFLDFSSFRNVYFCRALEKKPECIKIVTSSINSLSKLTGFMDTLALETVLRCIEIAAKGPANEPLHPCAYICLENRNVCLATLDLFSGFLTDQVYSTLNFDSKLLLVEYMLCFVERPSSDSNIPTEALKLLKQNLVLVAKHEVKLPDELKEKLTMLLSRKLLDNKEPVVDNALHLAEEIISCKGNEQWRESVMKHNIHMIVWEIAIEGKNDGYVKASALKAITEGCINKYYWDDIQLAKKVNEVGFMEIMCKYFHNPDFFIQRESLSCIHKWFQSNEHFLSEYSSKVFGILFCAIKSLDLELKLTALKMWQWLLSSSSICGTTKSSDINVYVKKLYNFGFIACILVSIEDYDNAVQFSTAKILLNLRQMLIKMQYTQNSLTIEESQLKSTTPVNTNHEIFKPISEAERDAGIDKVLNISTTEQLTNIYCKTLEESIQNVCHCSDFPSVATDPTSFSNKSFWEYLWCNELNDILNLKDKTKSVFSAHSMSLLDDIIASEETEVNKCADDGLDCY
ncbi:hypothetical protein JTE90_008073 [Oedothorax gibbosus]|uniref:BRCA1-associated ATM activator 1 n=1 Tax=Oedothorax gibbosus TaxID=931172 RepID=A0AAV6UXH4_9ARAC|nr:hypothetical protein JTE90_008073 [Oedothorax gibbosus]